MSWKKALRPLFDIVARPGIGLPHAFDPALTEMELMLAGAKSVMIANQDFLTPEFKAALSEDRIIEIGSQKFESNGHASGVAVYALKGDAEMGRELFRLYYGVDWSNSSEAEKTDGIKRIAKFSVIRRKI